MVDPTTKGQTTFDIYDFSMIMIIINKERQVLFHLHLIND